MYIIVLCYFTIDADDHLVRGSSVYIIVLFYVTIDAEDHLVRGSFVYIIVLNIIMNHIHV